MLYLLVISCLAGVVLGDDATVDALPLCPGHVADAFSVTGLAIRLHTGEDVLDVQVSYKTRLPVTSTWLRKIGIEDTCPEARSISSANVGIRDGKYIKIVNEYLQQSGEGRTVLKVKYSKFDKLLDDKIPQLEFMIQRENGLITSVLLEFDEISLSYDELSTNQKITYPQHFTLSQLPPSEYDSDTNDCKMEVLVKESPTRLSGSSVRARQKRGTSVNEGNDLPRFSMRSLEDYPKRRLEPDYDFLFFRSGRYIQSDDSYEAKLAFAPDSRPESVRYQAKGYVYSYRKERYDENYVVFTLTAISKRNSATTETFSEGGSEITDSAYFLLSTFFETDPSATIKFRGSDPGEIVCKRHFTGADDSPRTADVSVEIAGISDVSTELRAPSGSSTMFGSYGYMEWSFFAMEDPDWLLLDSSRCRCRHTLTDGSLVFSPWKEVKFV